MVKNQNNFKLVDSSKQELIKKLRIIAKEGREHLEARGFTEDDLRVK